MPSSTSSQESRVSPGGRTLLQKRPHFGSGDNRTNGIKLPRPRPTFDVPKDVEEECEEALAAIAHRWEGRLEARREAYRSVHAHAAAVEDDDEDFQVLGVTPSRTMLRSGKNVLDPLTDCKGVAVGYAADVTKRARVVFQKDKDGIHELWVYTTPAQGLIRSVVEVEKEAASLKAAREKSLDAQIRYLENQVHIYTADAITLKSAFDARLAHAARNSYPRARDRQIRKCFRSFQAVVAVNAATAWLYYENRLEDKKAELEHLMHGPQPSAAAGEQMGSNYSWKAEMATAIVQEIVTGRE